MTGKQKCRILKEIRRQIAEKNDIRFVVHECTHKGKCRGTCPRCEAEVRMLERELEKRRLAGKSVVLAGISSAFLLSSCSPVETVREWIHTAVQPLEGDMQAAYTETAEAAAEIPGEIAETYPVIEGDLIQPVIEEGEVAMEIEEGEPYVPEYETDDPDIEPTAGVPILEEYVLEGDPVLSDGEDETDHE